MTKNVLTLSAVVLALAIGAWFTAPLGGRALPLRSRHSEQTAARTPALVAVTPEGKLYHRPECPYIHGPVRMEPGEQAMAEGYTPCRRCLKP